MKHAGTITSRLFSIQHDGWSSISSMYVKNGDGCLQKRLCGAYLSILLIRRNLRWIWQTTYSISSDYHRMISFPLPKIMLLHRSISNTAQLFIMHTVENVAENNDSINIVQAVCVILRGNNSNDRVREMKRCCDVVGIKYLKVRLYGTAKN